MASIAPITPAPAMQPGLKPFIVYDQVPAGLAAYPVTNNHHAPLLRAGDWVIYDPTDREAVHGELYVLRWQSGDRIPQVVEVGLQKEDRWAVGARHRGVNAKELVFGNIGEIVGDSGYRAAQLTERFLGRVVGLLEPASEPMLQIVGGLN